MHDYVKKNPVKSAQPNKAPAQPEMTNGIPNSVLTDVFAGRKHATSEMMGHSQNLAPSIAAKMSQAFGMDLTGMQVYRSDAMKDTGMRGMAQGNKIVLSSDVDLNTTAGQAVLGHEISHIHAQSQGIGMGNSGLYENAALEHQADTEGLLAAQGRSIYQGGMDIGIGMSYGLGMQGVEGLTPLGGGMSANAGAPMQANKLSNLFSGKKKSTKKKELNAAILAAAQPDEDELKTEQEKENVIDEWGMAGSLPGKTLEQFNVDKEKEMLGYSTPQYAKNYPTKKYKKSDDAVDEKAVSGKDIQDLEKFQNLKRKSPKKYEKIYEKYEKTHRKNVDTSMGKVQSRQFYTTMNQKERMSMLEYTSNNYTNYNNYLRFGLDVAKQKMGENIEKYKKTIETKNIGEALKNNAIIKKNREENNLKYADKLPEKTEALKGALDRYAAPYDLTVWRSIPRVVYEEKLLGKTPQVGNVISDAGFMSASTDKSICEEWGNKEPENNVILEIRIDKGTHVGAPVGDMTAMKDSEHEFLLSPKTMLVVYDLGDEEAKEKNKIQTVKCYAIDNSSEGKEKA